MAKKVTEGLKAGERFSMNGNIDKVKRTYTTVERTTGSKGVNGQTVLLQNVVALNEETGARTVFELSALVGTAVYI